MFKWNCIRLRNDDVIITTNGTQREDLQNIQLKNVGIVEQSARSYKTTLSSSRTLFSSTRSMKSDKGVLERTTPPSLNDEDQALLEQCLRIRKESHLASLQIMRQHVIQYLNQNLDCWLRATGTCDIQNSNSDNHCYHKHLLVREESRFGNVEIMYPKDKINHDDNDYHFDSNQPKVPISIRHLNLCSYEDWIMTIHPENAKLKIRSRSGRFKITKRGLRKSKAEFTHNLNLILDDRFYHPDSDHLKLWNESVESYGCSDLKIQPKLVKI
jgi:hypothetical protein